MDATGSRERHRAREGTTGRTPEQIAFLPLLAFLVSVSGWRAASITVAAVALLLVPITVLLMKNRPEDVGVRAYGSMEVEVPPRPAGNPIVASLRGLRLGARSGGFWLLAGSFFISGASTNGLIGTHLIPAAMDHGMSEVTAATLLATVGFFDIFGTVFSGWLREWNPWEVGTALTLFVIQAWYTLTVLGPTGVGTPFDNGSTC